MNNQTLEKLRQMRLFGMHDAFKTSLENTIKEKMTQDQFVSHLVQSEFDNRKNRAVERAVRAAQFRYNAALDDVDYTFERGLDRNQVERLAAMEFVRDHKDLIITGPPETVTSYLATSLGYKACQDGFRVMYASTAKLMNQLKSPWKRRMFSCLWDSALPMIISTVTPMIRRGKRMRLSIGINTAGFVLSAGRRRN